MSAQQPQSSPGIRHGGRILADQLARLGADTVFCVPGESFLGLLDGLFDHRDSIRTVTCRHEAGAANMAEAHGKLTGRPGICAVTRGPGATHAANGVHTAFQDSTPLILLIGQVGRNIQDREAFQEMDYRPVFGQMAKWVAQIEDASRIPEYMARAWALAISGRPGPVVLALPEDMLRDRVEVADLSPPRPPSPAPHPSEMDTLAGLLAKAQHPMLVVGGPGWSADCGAKAMALATAAGLPVAASFRCQDYVDNSHPHFVGTLGIAPLPTLRQRVREEVDLLIVLGARMGEMTTQGYSLIDVPTPQMPLVHVHPDADELGHVYTPALSIAATSQAFLDAATASIGTNPPPGRADWIAAQRAEYEAFQSPVDVPGALNLSTVIGHINKTMPADTILTNGAGNYTVWGHRFYRHSRFRTLLAPTSGSMGYGIPAAVAAKLHYPDRAVIAMAGDGCFLMSAQEMATARHHGADIIYLVFNNGMLGTIRMHQERSHPDRNWATDLTNPDFVAYAAAFGIAGEKVETTEAFAAALDRARTQKGGYLIELTVDPEALSPTQSLTNVIQQGRESARHKGQSDG